MSPTRAGPLRLLSLRHVDADNRNAQSLTAREILRRLPPDRFRATAFCARAPDPVLAGAAHVRVHRLPARLRTPYVVWRARRDGVDALFHPQPDRYDRRIERLLAATGRPLPLVVHVVLDVASPAATEDYLVHVRDHVRRAAILTANSEHVAEGVAARFGRRPEVLENGVDLGVFRPRSGARRDGGRATVAVVASFRPRKRHDLVLEAAARLPEVSFWCAGEGDEAARRAFAQTVEARGLRNVEVVGVLPAADLAARLAASDVLFHPSEHEGAPQALLQAQACGCVPVARAAYRPPTVRDGVSGVLAGDDRGLLEALGRLVGDPAARARLAQGARAEAERRSWDVVADRWAAILGRLGGAGSAARGGPEA